jgi:ABC-2 type transport system ATP-binding protein
MAETEQATSAAPAVLAEGLGKVYKSPKRDSAGLKASLKSFWRPEYREVEAVAGINFRLEPGEIRALIGPNGAGKSTLIKMLCGVLHPSYGKVSCLGMEPWRQREDYVRRIGAVFGQKTQLMWDLPALDSFQINKKIYRISDAVYKRSIDYFEARFGLSAFQDRPVRSLSLGERMRCELVAALLHEPSLVFLDEPTIGMDILAKDMVRQFVRDVNRERGVTFILTTHDLGDVENLCERISVINHGRVVFDGEQESLKRAFGGVKLLELSFARPLDARELERARGEGARLPEGNVAMSAAWELSCDGEASSAWIAQLLVAYPVADIAIRDPEIEDIIRQLYAKEQQATASGVGSA